jgi:hypothetical protein
LIDQSPAGRGQEIRKRAPLQIILNSRKPRAIVRNYLRQRSKWRIDHALPIALRRTNAPIAAGTFH